MLETSKDLLNVLLGISVSVVAVMFAWVLFESASAIRGVNDIIKKVQKIVSSIEEGVETVKSKSGQAAAYLNLLIKAGQQVVKHINNRKGSESSDKRTKASRKK